jgi:hypothetical protein
VSRLDVLSCRYDKTSVLVSADFGGQPPGKFKKWIVGGECDLEGGDLAAGSSEGRVYIFHLLARPTTLR